MTTTSEKVASIAADMYSARKSVRSIMGDDKFRECVEGFRPIMADLCREHGLSEMKATIEMLQSLASTGAPAMASMIAMAACTEIMEPSLPKVDWQGGGHAKSQEG